MIRTILGICVLSAVCGAPLVAQRISLRADSESQLMQNRRAAEDRLGFIEDEQMVGRYSRLKLLEPIPARTRNYYVYKVPASRRYLRPWSKLFLDRLSQQFRARFGKPLRVTSLVRTEEYQETLQGRNGNAASAQGPKRSTHLTGACLDISKKGMRSSEILWMRRVLDSLKQKGYLFAVEEFSQPNFHIMVFRNYTEYVEQRLEDSAGGG
jgi:hypothetical protein